MNLKQVKIKFHSNEIIEWHCMHFELSKFKYIDWNLNWIEFQFNWQEMGCKLVEKVWKKNTFKKHKYKKMSFYAFLLRNGLNRFWARIWSNKILWNLIIILPKRTNESSSLKSIKVECQIKLDILSLTNNKCYEILQSWLNFLFLQLGQRISWSFFMVFSCFLDWLVCHQVFKSILVLMGFY